MKNLLRSGLALMLALWATALPALAQITFTVTATAENTPGNVAQNYIPGQAYTFVYTLTADYPLNHNYFPGQNNGWFEQDITTEPALFTAVGGTGLGGTFIDPTAPTGSPFSFVRTQGSSFLGLFAGADAGNIGLTTLSGSTLTHAIASMNLGGLDFAKPASYINPADYFADYLGDHQAWGGSVGLYGGGFDGATFQVTGLSIGTPAAIPEPSTYAALLGLGALGVVIWRRRERSQPPIPETDKKRAIGVPGVTVGLPSRMKNFFSRLAVVGFLLAGGWTASAQVTTAVLAGGDAGQGLTLDAGNVVTAWNVYGSDDTLQGVSFTNQAAGGQFSGSIAFGGGENSVDDLALAGLINQGGFAIGTPLQFTFTSLTPLAAYRLDLLQSTLAFASREQAIVVNGDLVTLVSLTAGQAYNTTFYTTADGSGEIDLLVAASGAYGGSGYQDGAVLNALVLTAVPEPSTAAALLGAVALGLVAWHRRRNRAL